MPGINVPSSSAQTAKLWAGQEQLFRDVLKNSRLNKFISDTGSSIVHLKRWAEKGDETTFTLRYRSKNGYLPSGTLIRGNEGNISTATDSVVVDDKNLGLITGLNIDRQRVPYDMPKETRQALIDDASESLTQAMFSELYNDTNTTDYLYVASGTFSHTATRATAKTAVEAADKLTPEIASKIKRWAMNNRANDRVPLQPVMVDGAPMIVVFISADVGFDFRTNSTWESAVKDAQLRSTKNPLFTGATATWDGMIFYEDEYVNGENYTNGGAGGAVNGSEILFCGKQALLYGVTGTPRVSEEGISHDQQISYGYLSQFGVKKPVYASDASGTDKQYGSVNVLVARSQVTDV